MYSFSKKSRSKLDTADPRLIQLAENVIKIIDHSIKFGHRGEIEQNMLADSKRSKLRFPDSAHNKTPSKAIDIQPYPFIGWDAPEAQILAQFTRLREVYYHEAGKLGIELKPLIIFKGSKTGDYPHIELVD